MCLERITEMRNLLIVLLLVGVAHKSQADEDPAMSLDDRQMDMLVKTYPSFFVRKREEQKAFIQRMLNDADYEKRYKMFDMAFTNIFKMLEVEKEPISRMTHKADVLPSTPKEFKAVVTVLENICIIGEVVLHFPEMSYKILEDREWRPHVEFARSIAQKYQFVYDSSTLKMLDLFNQEINPEQRTEDFVNPYAEGDASAKKSKKPKKKANKGPKLQEL